MNDREVNKVLYTASTSGHLKAFHQPYLEWFAQQGWQVHTAAAGDGTGQSCVSRHLRLEFEKQILSPRNLLLAWQLSRHLRREDYRLISTHTSLAAFFTRLAVLLAGKGDTVVLNTVHGYLFDRDTPPLKRALLLGAERLTAGVTDAILTMNCQDTQIAREHRLCRGPVVQTDGMGVDVRRLLEVPASRQALRQAFGFGEEQLVLVYAAEFSKRKNQAMLIRAMKLLPEPFCLLLAGQGSTLEECRSLAAQLGVGHRVRFAGFVSPVQRCYLAADLCVSSSRSEGLPFNLMEAMFCGLPVVATQVKGHEDLVRPGENGYLYPYGDLQSYCEAVQRLANSPQTRRQMGQQARSLVERYSLERVFPRLTQLYLQLLHGEELGGTQ